MATISSLDPLAYLRQRLCLTLEGTVQGVGFRPFVYALATDLHLGGWVQNSPQGVRIEVEGPTERLHQFLSRLHQEKPRHARFLKVETTWLPPMLGADCSSPFSENGVHDQDEDFDNVWQDRFEIRQSEMSGNPQANPSENYSKAALILPDLATCSDCLKEVFDPGDRRFKYAFTNCTHCGPRYTIVRSLPYDRERTTMAGFPMCEDCQVEYGNPHDRRFHAQPNACPQCGPQLQLWDRKGRAIASSSQSLFESSETVFKKPKELTQELVAEELLTTSSAESLKISFLPDLFPVPEHYRPIIQAAAALKAGKILAVKGLGGFHLVVDAQNEAAVQTLRQRKHRPRKPFALMYPSLEQVRATCVVREEEVHVLQSPEAPIVLLSRRQSPDAYLQGDPTIGSTIAPTIAPSVAPGNPSLGVMLPSTPLHHLLLGELGGPVVATSGNPSGEPICTEEHQALTQLGTIADLFLVHDRPIARPVDDSIVRVVAAQTRVLRRARGYAPLPLALPQTVLPQEPEQPLLKGSIVAVGGHLKNTVAFYWNQCIFASEYLGDLDSPATLERVRRAIAHFGAMYDTQPSLVACDAHPDYASTQFAQQLAQQLTIPVISVQHHYAHLLSCMADNGLEPPVLGIAWDGTGYGSDGTLWGGEALTIRDWASGYNRVAHLRPFPLPGGDKAARDPRRSALGLLSECLGLDGLDGLNWQEWPSLREFNSQERKILLSMVHQRIHSPLTSSMGRLFDGVASLLDVCQHISFEGEAAMALEFQQILDPAPESYPFPLIPHHVRNPSVIDPIAPETIVAPQTKVQVPLPWQLDWRPMVQAILHDQRNGVPVGQISAKFHQTLVEAIADLAEQIGRSQGISQIVLTGGCFQNHYLLEQTLGRLESEGFSAYGHQQIPPNDGGIAVGQILAALAHISQL